MQGDKGQYPSEAAEDDNERMVDGDVSAEDPHVSAPSEERPAQDPLDEAPLSNNRAGRDAYDASRGAGIGVASTADGPALLWTMDEETVLLHSSEASLKRIRTRLENLLLGVSHALRVRETRGDAPDPFESRAATAARHKPRPALDFADAVLVADHAIRRMAGEAASKFEEDEVVQMVQLCSLADRGTDDCDELVRNAVVVLQALTRDGEAVRSVEHFRKFVRLHGEEMASEQWRHDFVTAFRSLAVGFLREPVATMASYGSSINQIVEHEALYVGLLRMCGDRPFGNTPHPKELPDNMDVAPLNAHLGQKAALASAKTRAPVGAKRSTAYIHTVKNASKPTQVRRPSTVHARPLPSAEDLEPAMGLLMGRASSSPNSPTQLSRSRKSSAVGPTPSQLRELRNSVSFSDPSMASELRASASCSRAEKPKTPYEPVPEVPQRLSIHRGRGPSMSHY